MAATPTTTATITLPKSFKLQSVDAKLSPKSAGRTAHTLLAAAADTTSSLEVLSKFRGTFVGNGFNTIWRPANGSHIFDNPVPDGNGSNPSIKPLPVKPNEAILELNLTTEELSFTKTLGDVPNRGLFKQKDIFLDGVSYIQVVRDVTNVNTGKADGIPEEIHFEPGLWMHVPKTDKDAASLARMGSIPHGTTINAQCPKPTAFGKEPKAEPIVNIKPFPIGNPAVRLPFPAMEITNKNASRLPQDLDKFIAAKTITQEILNNPKLLLVNANKTPGKKILDTVTFKVSTASNFPALVISDPKPQAGSTDVAEAQAASDSNGISNIAFLEGKSVEPPLPSATASEPPVQNADTALMTAEFWISTVQQEIELPKFTKGSPPLRIGAPSEIPGTAVPFFVVNPLDDITKPTTILVKYTQIQYSQQVNLDFATLTWPHASVATLVPAADIVVEDIVFK